uniref:Uncharacterized protein n=1 Tax=Rhizophora mucronata TaxID=61149 RepID=A0A2P2QGI2_RHIMU
MEHIQRDRVQENSRSLVSTLFCSKEHSQIDSTSHLI